MSACVDLTYYFGNRKELRKNTNIFATIESVHNRDEQLLNAMIVDVSKSGAGLVTETILPVGSVIAIYIAGEVAAIGEVVNTRLGKWGKCSVRLGMRLNKKTQNWPWTIFQTIETRPIKLSEC